jgi:hypothetical protein
MARPVSDAIPDFRRRLLRWFRGHGRDLPWRRTRDPYHVIVSEFMLQQTQVSRVEPYYGRFLNSFPSLEALAGATGTMVRESWAGLGYYRRADNLHLLARRVVQEHGGVIPSDPQGSEETARRRALHRRCCGQLRVRALRSSSRHQRGSSDPASLSPSLLQQSAELACLADGGADRPQAWEDCVGVQPGNHGARCTDLYCASGKMWRVSGPGCLCDRKTIDCHPGAAWSAATAATGTEAPGLIVT